MLSRESTIEKAQPSFKYRLAFWMIVGLGVILRLWQYFLNRSLWLDEAGLALNIISRSFKELLGQLDFGYVSPIGFLFIEKAAVTLLGINEYALRLWPLIAGILSLLLFTLVARFCCNSRASLIAVTLFAVSDRIIYYSSEVKPCSSDVAITLAILLAVLNVKQGGFAKLKLVMLAAIGAVAVWLSSPALFMLLAAVIILIGGRENKVPLSWIIAICFLWLASAAFCYFLSLPQLAATKFMVEFWQFSLAPFPFSSLIDFQWYIKILPALMDNPGGFSLSGLALFAALVGGISMLSDKKYSILILLLGPVLFAFIASGLNRYPIYGRFMLFAVPSALLLIAEGIDVFMKASNRPVKTAGITLICLLMLNPLWLSAKSLSQPRRGPLGHSEIRPVLEYLKRRREPEDIIYSHHGATLACKYYLFSEEISFIEGVWSSESSQKYIDDIEKLRGNSRVWFLFTNTHPWLGINEESFFIDYLNKIGKLKESYKSLGAAAYLYDLGKHQVL